MSLYRSICTGNGGNPQGRRQSEKETQTHSSFTASDIYSKLPETPIGPLRNDLEPTYLVKSKPNSLSGIQCPSLHSLNPISHYGTLPRESKLVCSSPPEFSGELLVSQPLPGSKPFPRGAPRSMPSLHTGTLHSAEEYYALLLAFTTTMSVRNNY